MRNEKNFNLEILKNKNSTSFKISHFLRIRARCYASPMIKNFDK